MMKERTARSANSYYLHRFFAIFSFMILSNGLTLWLTADWRSGGEDDSSLATAPFGSPPFDLVQTTRTGSGGVTTSASAAKAPANFSGVVARPYDAWPESSPLPCYEPEARWFKQGVQTAPASRGLFFVKPYKTGSSTAAGVHLRIARNVARRQRREQREDQERGLRQQGSSSSSSSSSDMCRVRFDHAVARYLYNNKDNGTGVAAGPRESPPHSFLWTIIRDPTERAVSQFFHFVVSRHKVEPSDRTFKMALSATTDYYLYILTMEDYRFTEEERSSSGGSGSSPATDIHRSHDPIKVANDILQTYDFIGITERFDESMVVMQMLLGLSTADVLYLSAKQKGGYDDGGGKRHCYYIWPSFISSTMRAYFASEIWQEKIRFDRLLYQAANASLDLTINYKLGRPAFEKQLAIFRRARQIAQERCYPEAVFPCSESGEYNNHTNCIWNDSGCGNDCLDRVATELGLW